MGASWDLIPTAWQSIRFDAVDVLFINPFEVPPSDLTFDLDLAKGGSLLKRLKRVVATARFTNPSIKIVLEQWYSPSSGTCDLSILSHEEKKIHKYAQSLVDFLKVWYKLNLPSPLGEDMTSTRLDGREVYIKGGNLAHPLPKVLEAVRASLDELSTKLKSPKFSVSITPAWTEFLDASVTTSVDYIDMQNYDGGRGTGPEDFKKTISELQDFQLV